MYSDTSHNLYVCSGLRGLVKHWSHAQAVLPKIRLRDAMDGFDNLSASEKAEATELQRLIAIEQQKAQFQAQVHNFTDVCWDKCVDSPGSKLDYRTETCLVSCVERFIDTTLTITNRFTQMVQKGTH
ncbi:mitochondrial import inner membrane translocase subunit Tim8 B [Hippocampus comes]|nr:PREDICTED: mitochondrial import inner membrane translocase subunit Tim8 B [Hippocampus comes]